MQVDDLLAVRKIAEQAVDDMAESPLKVKAFEVILSSLLAARRPVSKTQVPTFGEPGTAEGYPLSFAGRINLLANEGFFALPRSLAEVQTALAEHGWHYPQENLSTPLVRLVRQRQLRRLQLVDGKRRIWKYSRP